MLYDAEDNEEEDLSGHEGESSSPKLLDISDDQDEEEDGTGAEDINGNGDGNIGGDRNTGARGGSAEWIRLLILGAQTEALGAMAKAKASSLTALRKKLKLGKSKSRIARKGKAAKKLVKNS